MYMSGEGRSFSTPGYPANPGVGTCSWNITVPQGEFVKVTFWDFGEWCPGNEAEVWDVTNSTYRRLGSYCHNYRVNEFYSVGNNVLVRFTSTYSKEYPGGFLASYEALKAVSARYSCTNGRYWWSKKVVYLHAHRGDFASYDYPLSYPNDVKCSWKIKGRAGYVIRITFHSFNMGPKPDPFEGDDCLFADDYVRIYESVYGDEYCRRRCSIIGKFCGFSPPFVIQSNYSNVDVHFEAGTTGRYPGFHASYEQLINRMFA